MNAMQNKLKGWLVDNTVTVDNKNDKILQLESNGNAGIDEIVKEMRAQDTGLREETLRHSISLYNRVVIDLLLNGLSVNTGLFYAVARTQGVIEKGTWNKENNSVYIVFNQGKELREACAKAVVEILGEKSNIMYILETEDIKTRLSDGSATAGRNFIVRGAMLKVAGDHEAVGVTLTDSKGAAVRLEEDMIVSNKPSELILLMPSDLADGEYTLTITTQYSRSVLLKEPRSLSTPIWVGGKASDSESPGEI